MYVSPLLDKTACCPWGGAGVGAVLQGNISPPGAGCCVLGRAAVHCTLLLGWRGGGATAAWSQWPGPAATHHHTTITTHHHTLTTGPMWQYQPGDTAAMLTNVDVGHGPAITGLRCIFGGCRSRQYTYFELWILIGNRKQRHSLLLFRDFKKSTDSHFCW